MIGVEVYLWGTLIGYVTQENSKSIPKFQYDEKFIHSGIELSPITMPLSSNIYSFPNLNEETFKGLPGLLADSLPDKFGTTLINDYLARQGRSVEDFSVIERLGYVGTRGMGALEFRPQIGIEDSDQSINIDELAELADKILSSRKEVSIPADEQAIGQLLKIGTSAGGARAKALIAWNEETGDIRSGQVDAGDGYGYWLLKFGTVKNNKDKDTENDHIEYPKIEYAYSLMAKDCGIYMTDCRLIKSAEGVHFVTRRFDRNKVTGEKIHMQSLGGLAHFDFNQPGTHSYEETIHIMKRLGLSQKDIEQLYRRLVFNEIAKNYDDHVKNISFLMDKRGTWSLAPAYDITFSYSPGSFWLSAHQMRINGKRENLTLEDIIAAGKSMGLSTKKIESILKKTVSVVREWPAYADFVELDNKTTEHIKSFHKYSSYYPEESSVCVELQKAKESGAAYIELPIINKQKR